MCQADFPFPVPATKGKYMELKMLKGRSVVYSHNPTEMRFQKRLAVSFFLSGCPQYLPTLNIADRETFLMMNKEAALTGLPHILNSEIRKMFAFTFSFQSDALSISWHATIILTPFPNFFPFRQRRKHAALKRDKTRRLLLHILVILVTRSNFV